MQKLSVEPIVLSKVKKVLFSWRVHGPALVPVIDVFSIYPSDFKLQGSEPHILFQFKEKNATE
jgi:hypothetical protein